MIDLVLVPSAEPKASLLFDRTLAVRLEQVPACAVFVEDQEIAETIAILQELWRFTRDYAGQPPVGLVVFRPAGLPDALFRRIERASLAAGFEHFDTLTLPVILPELVAMEPALRLIALEGSAGRIGGYLLKASPDNRLDVIKQTSRGLDEAGLRDDFSAAITAQTGKTSATTGAMARELLGAWLDSSAESWLLETRRWSVRQGWISAALSPSDVASSEARIAGVIDEILSDLDPDGAAGAIIVIGEGANRLSCLSAIDRRGYRSMPSQFTDLLGAAIVGMRAVPVPTADQAAVRKDVPAITFRFDPRSAIELSDTEYRKENAGVMVPVALDSGMVIANVPTRWHRAGIEVEISLAGKVQCLRLFEGRIEPIAPTFSLEIAARSSANGDTIRVAIPQFDRAALLCLDPGGNGKVDVHDYPLLR